MLIMSNSPQAFIVIQNLFSSPSLPFHFCSFFFSLSLSLRKLRELKCNECKDGFYFLLYWGVVNLC